MIGALGLSQAVVGAWRGENVRVGGADFLVPGTRRIRLSVVAGNVRMHRLLDRFVRPGATVIDVGANIGYNTIHAARLAGPLGRVFAVEPATDNVEVLRRNLTAAGIANVIVAPVAAGRVAGTRTFFVRGARSAVNSLFAESCYAAVTDVRQVAVMPLDELVDGTAQVVKIDVEGAELDVLEGMPRLLQARPDALVVEWHPLLQVMAGYAPAELPLWLLRRRWRLRAVSHTTVRTLTARTLDRLTARLLRHGRPVELLAVPLPI